MSEINILPVQDTMSGSRHFVLVTHNFCRSSVYIILLKFENLPVIVTVRERILSVTHEIVPDRDRWPVVISCTAYVKMKEKEEVSFYPPHPHAYRQAIIFLALPSHDQLFKFPLLANFSEPFIVTLKTFVSLKVIPLVIPYGECSLVCMFFSVLADGVVLLTGYVKRSLP